MPLQFLRFLADFGGAADDDDDVAVVIVDFGHRM